MRFYIKTKAGYISEFNKDLMIASYTKMITLAKSWSSKQAAQSWWRRNTDCGYGISGKAQIVNS